MQHTVGEYKVNVNVNTTQHDTDGISLVREKGRSTEPPQGSRRGLCVAGFALSSLSQGASPYSLSRAGEKPRPRNPVTQHS